MRVKYVGLDDARDLALPGGFIRFERGEWVDLEEASLEAGIPLHHLEVLDFGDDWETSGTTKAARTPEQMTKAELVDLAADRGIVVDPKATKAELVDAIELSIAETAAEPEPGVEQ